jgi:hypothetical protein
MTNLTNLEEKLNKSLLTILNSPNLAAGLKTKQLQDIFEKEMNILGFLIKNNKSANQDLGTIIEKYNTLSKKKFVLDSKIFYEDKDLLTDDINYLNIYIRNIYKIDLDALAEGKKANITQSSVSEVQQKDRGFAKQFGGFAMPGFGNIEGMPSESNPYFISLANMRLNDEIRKGNVYAFKTKPKIIPILKYVIIALALLATLSCVFVGIGLIISNGNKNLDTDNSWMP